MGGANLLGKRRSELFTEGSKLKAKVGVQVSFREFSINSCFRLSDHCSVFQAEIVAIKVAADELPRSAACFREVCIYSDSRATIRALSSLTVSSKLDKKSMTSLAVASSYFDIILLS